jgi:hypothetical protein
MPLMVAAMACRALAPAGFMTMTGSATPVASMLCSLDKDRRERLQFPDERRQEHAPRCDHCVSGPMGWVPVASLHLDFTPFVSPLITVPASSQLANAPVPRSQSPRAPPAA